MELVIDLGGNQLELAVLKGYLSFSKAAPQNVKLTHEGRELRVQSEHDVTAGELSELLRVLGGSCKGDTPIRVIAPQVFEGATAIPHESAGAARWKCPRCDRDVMQGANDAGTLHGLCRPCWETDMKVAGQPVPPLPPTPSAPVAAVPVAPALSASPSSRTLTEALAPLGDSSGPPPASIPFTALVPLKALCRCVATMRDLPRAEDAPGCLAIVNERLAYSNGCVWRVLDGHVPPHE
jgi:hypothetical protein